MPIIINAITAIFSIFSLLSKYLSVAAITGLISRGMAFFFTANGLSILAGLGLGYSTYVGIDVIVDLAISQVTQSINSLESQSQVVVGNSGQSFNWAGYMLKLASYAGLFDALEIVIAGFLVANSMTTFKLILNRVMPN